MNLYEIQIYLISESILFIHKIFFIARSISTALNEKEHIIQILTWLFVFYIMEPVIYHSYDK